MFRLNQSFDKLLEKATSHLLMEPDWIPIIQICDLIRQDDVQPRYALNALKKKLTSTNPHSALYALLVLESIVKNCGSKVHEEVTTKANCDFLRELARSPHENVRNKVLELIQAWNFAFRNNPKHGALKELMNTMKMEGHKFPVFRESDAMFSADTAPEWADGDVCHRCRVAFSLIQRKHHCRACGQVFCGQCTQKTASLPKYGIEKEVRVCDSCFEQATKPSAATKAAQEKQDTELPPEYLKSSLAQQNQEPPRKTEDELREEEEFQLALALSQSEAEAKEKEKLRLTNTLHNNYNSKSAVDVRQIEAAPPPPQHPVMEETMPELAHYLNRSYWESLHLNDSNEQPRPTSPSAPATVQNNESKSKLRENGVSDNDLEGFMKTLKSQVEIFINRMKSNSSRGRSIANDTSVQTLFMNITAMHSQLLHYIQEHDDSRLHFEALQDKLTQVKDAREALDALREEHREKLRREAEEAERQRQLQMAHKLEIMRKKKQEYLQYQRQLALQRIQEQEREMQMRQEQQKQQYLMGPQQFQGAGTYLGSPVHAQQFQQAPHSAPPQGVYHGYQYATMMGPGQQQPPQSAPHLGPPPGLPPQNMQMPQMTYTPTLPPSTPNNPQQVGQFPQQAVMHHQPQPPQQLGPNVMLPPGAQGLPPANAPGQIGGQFPPPPPPQNGEAETGELISFD